MGLTKWIEIARTGTFTDMSGVPITIDQAMLDSLVSSFDETRRRVPLVFGHPKTNAPAFGWVAELHRQGDRLRARFRDVPGEVNKTVVAGHYRNVSMSVGPDGLLWHVGLLGAKQPAIDGLAPVDLAETEGRTIVFAVPGDNSDNPEGNMDPSEMEALKKRIAELEAELGEVKKSLAMAQGELESERNDFAAYKDSQKSKGRTSRFDALVKQGKVLPSEREKVLRRAALLGGSEEKTILFAAKGGATEEITPEEEYWRELESREDNGLLREFAAPGGDGDGETLNTGSLAGKF